MTGPAEAFHALAGHLPAFASGQQLPDATAYFDYYGLDFSAEYPELRHRLGYIQSGDHRLALQTWVQPGATATVHLVHGYFDHVGLYSHLVRYGLDRGSNVVAFDLPGHGLSTGPRAEISDFAEYRQAMLDVLAASAELPGPRQVIAQSTGGAAVMDFLQCAGQPEAFDAVILLAPLVWPHGWRRISLAYQMLHRFVDAVPRKFAENSQDPEFLEFLPTDPLQHDQIPVCWVGALKHWLKAFLARPPCEVPVLVVQGDNDGTVDWRRNLPELRRRFPKARVEILPTGMHHLVNESGPVRERMLAVITDYLDSAPGYRALDSRAPDSRAPD